MIVQEIIDIKNGKEQLKHTKSDSNLLIRKVGTAELYESALDILDSEFEYEETEFEIEPREK